VAALVLSAAGGSAIALWPGSPWPLAALPAVLLLRMALNALDGMMAREHDLATPLGAMLNETGDVAADAALYLPLALVPGFHPALVVVIVVLAGLTELVGVTAASLGGTRRYDGPMGKSDRAFVLSVLALIAAWRPAAGEWFGPVLALVAAAEVLTIANRARSALGEITR
jgi:CDP-diacylglycerol--glycerol-3-phosphate 3-phosphatidyltransferase